MDKIIVEVGSTVTKVDKFNGEVVTSLDGKTIEFKKHLLERKTLLGSDVNELIDLINSLKTISQDIYVCGTSVFRSLDENIKTSFLDTIKTKTGYTFNIISQEEESELTVIGATRFVKDRVCVFTAGGGSTEITIYDKGIVETVNTNIGVIDIMQKFPDLADDIATSNVQEVKDYIKQKLNLPKGKADILILAGGAHEKFARLSGVKFEDNNLYQDTKSPIMMDIETRKTETERYFKEISLDEIRSRVKDPKWWYATRAMTAFVLVAAEAIDAKYIIPTDIAMVYGIVQKLSEK